MHGWISRVVDRRTDGWIGGWIDEIERRVIGICPWKARTYTHAVRVKILPLLLPLRVMTRVTE
jgi:hypothetical protein